MVHRISPFSPLKSLRQAGPDAIEHRLKSLILRYYLSSWASGWRRFLMARTIRPIVLRASKLRMGVWAFSFLLVSVSHFRAGAFRMLTKDEFLPGRRELFIFPRVFSVLGAAAACEP